MCVAFVLGKTHCLRVLVSLVGILTDDVVVDGMRLRKGRLNEASRKVKRKCVQQSWRGSWLLLALPRYITASGLKDQSQ